MHIVVVHVRVKPECAPAFVEETLKNARQSVREPGIARFDFTQDVENRSHFILVEAYRAPSDQDEHRKTAHYLAWREAVAPMMAEARAATKLVNLFPPDSGW